MKGFPVMSRLTLQCRLVEGDPMPSFARDVRSLFRDKDVDEMRFAFDLSRYEDVKSNAASIANRLGDGSMPCDAPWPAERIALFRQWIDEGCSP